MNRYPATRRNLRPRPPHWVVVQELGESWQTTPLSSMADELSSSLMSGTIGYHEGHDLQLVCGIASA